jgi:crossover junction endodeoxyribonuclease RuvC
MARILGIDPGLQRTGWGCIGAVGGALEYVGHGVVSVAASLAMPLRLQHLYAELLDIIEQLKPDCVAIEEVFVNKNGASTMKLCMARGVAMLAPAMLGVDVFEYSANCVKKTVTGSGHADKSQVKFMVEQLLNATPGDRATGVRATFATLGERATGERATFATLGERATGERATGDRATFDNLGERATFDDSDALALAICHAQHLGLKRWCA